MKTLFLLCFLSLNLNTNPAKDFVNPQYPGGTQALSSFIEANLDYPEQAREMREEGTVQFRIYLDEIGDIYHVSFTGQVSSTFKSAILNLTEQMPQWKPAMAGNKKIRAGVNLSVVFKLQ